MPTSTIPGTYTPEQIAALELREACPYWQRVNPRGYCVNKWWAGGPMARIVDGLAVVAGMAVLGMIVAEASKYTALRPAIEKFKKSREHAKILRNRPRRRARRKARRLRRY